MPASVSWEPDLWGKVRNAIHEQQYNAQLSAADLENEKLTEQSSLAAFFFEIRGQDALQKLLNETVDADKKALELARARYETGIDTRISVAEAEARWRRCSRRRPTSAWRGRSSNMRLLCWWERTRRSFRFR